MCKELTDNKEKWTKDLDKDSQARLTKWSISVFKRCVQPH